MSRRKFEADRDNLPESPIQEEEEILPDLIIERVPKRKSDDESEIFYSQLRKKMRSYCRFLSNTEKDGSNSSDFKDIKKKTGLDDSVESNMNRLFMKNFKVYNNGLNKNASDDINDTFNLEVNQPVADHVSSKVTEDEMEEEIVSAAEETMKTEEIDSKETSRSASSDAVSTEEHDQSHSEPRSYLSFKSDRTSSESLILPTHIPHQESLLKKNDKIKQSDGVISQITRIKAADEEGIENTDAMDSVNAKEKDGSNSNFKDFLNKAGPDDSSASSDAVSTEEHDQSHSEPRSSSSFKSDRTSSESLILPTHIPHQKSLLKKHDKIKQSDGVISQITRIKAADEEGIENTDAMDSVNAKEKDGSNSNFKDFLNKAGPDDSSASSDAVSTEEHDQSHSEPRSSSSFKSDRTSSESLILPTHIPHQKSLLKKHDKSKQSDGVISQINKSKAADEDIENTEAMDSDNAKYNEQCVKSTNSDIIGGQQKEKLQSIDKENSKNLGEKGSYQLKDKENAGRFARNIIEKYDYMMMDQVEVMRSQNFLPSSTQSLNCTSNYSFSTQTFDLKRRDEFMVRHSIESERESMELDILASRPMDITETSYDDFHRFMRCSTPICVDREHRDKHFDVHSNPVDHDMSTNKIATVQHSPPIHNVPSTTKETNVLKIQNFNDVAAQTDLIIEKDKVLVDIGVQVDETEKNVSSVYMQTDEHKVLVDIGVQVEKREKNVRSVYVQTEEHENLDSLVSQRLFRRGFTI